MIHELNNCLQMGDSGLWTLLGLSGAISRENQADITSYTMTGTPSDSICNRCKSGTKTGMCMYNVSAICFKSLTVPHQQYNLKGQLPYSGGFLVVAQWRDRQQRVPGHVYVLFGQRHAEPGQWLAAILDPVCGFYCSGLSKLQVSFFKDFKHAPCCIG